MVELLKAQIRDRARARCEYCRMTEAGEFLDFECDHIIVQKHGGTTIFENLAYACFHCNSYKGPNLAGFDAITQRVVRLFHPRRDRWNQHFRWDGPRLVGKTPIGRVTVDVLKINIPESIELREILIEEGIFP